MARRSLAAVLALIGFLFLAAGVPAVARAQQPPLEVTLTLDRGAYEPGAAIGYTIKVRNTAATSLTLTYGSGQRYDIVIRRGVAEVARWSVGQAFTALYGTQTMAPGEVVVYSGQWTPVTAIIPTNVGAGPVFQPLSPALYAITAETANVGTHAVSAPQTLIVGRPLDLAAGCTAVTLTFAVSLPSPTVAGTVDPPAALQAMWRYDTATQRYLGFSPVLSAPSDLSSFQPGDTAVVCVSGPAHILLPNP